MTTRDEHEGEPIPGLPAELPPGEQLLWQGQPDWRRLARDVFKLHWLAWYFGFLCALRCVVGWGDEHWLRDLALSLLVSLTCLGVLALLAYLHARTSMYTITSRRVVMRIGIALPVTWNLPFKRLAAAQLATRTNDIVLELAAPERVSFVQFWPHTQPGRVRHAHPCLRALAEPQRVAAVLGEAVHAWSLGTVTRAAPAAPVAAKARHSDAPSVPRPLLWAAGALMLSSIALAAVGRSGQRTESAAFAQQVVELRFEDRPDGALAVLDGATERELKVLPPGSNNFIRGVLRGMFRVRKLEALGRDVQFRLAREASGKLTLEDRELGRRIELDSFGPDNTAAFAELLEAGVHDALATHVLTEVTGGQHGDYPRP
jgi:putative photosynthetic complex assembly protein